MSVYSVVIPKPKNKSWVKNPLELKVYMISNGFGESKSFILPINTSEYEFEIPDNFEFSVSKNRIIDFFYIEAIYYNADMSNKEIISLVPMSVV